MTTRKLSEDWAGEETEHPEVSAVFRSSFPDAESTDFRTNSWRSEPPGRSKQLSPFFPTMLHAFASAAKREDLGVTLLPDDEDGREETRSYRRLYDDARRLSSVLREMGVKPGQCVLLVLPTSFDFIVAFFAVQMAGAIAVPSYPPAFLEQAETALERLRHHARHSGAKVILTQRLLLGLLGELALSVPTVHSLWAMESLFERKPRQKHRMVARASDLAFVQYTSGSTGSPKGVGLTHRNLVMNVHAMGLALKARRTDKICTWLPLYHDMGLIGGLLSPLYWKLPLILMSPLAFLTRPVRWLRAIDHYRATISMGPNFAYGLCAKRVRPSEREGLDLSTWRIALNGAEPINLHTLRDFDEAFRPHGFREGTHYPCYGLAECSVAVTFPEPGAKLHYQNVDRAELANGRVVPKEGKGAMAVVRVGRPVAGHSLAVVDAEGAPVGEGKVGHLVVSGPSVMQGYYRDEDATAKVLRGGWLWTGDLGFQTPEGLFVTGRAKDLLIVRGHNHYAEDLERQAERVEGVRPGSAVAFGLYDEEKATDLAVLVCETKLRGEKSLQALSSAISEAVVGTCGLKLDQVVMVPPGTVPKTSSGKKQRSRCRELYLAHQLQPRKTGKTRAALIMVRSAAGIISMFSKRLTRNLRDPDA